MKYHIINIRIIHHILNMKKQITFMLIYICCVGILSAQKQEVTIDLTLEQAIDIAFRQSIYSFKQKNMYLSKYWEFRTYKATKLPSLDFSSTIFDYDRSIQSDYDSDTQEYEFYSSESLSSDGTMSLTQNIIATGGEISIYSNFDRVQYMQSGNHYFATEPFSISISQPIGGYNDFKWESLLEPLAFEQAKREYLQSLQEMAEETTSSFFDAIMAEINLSIAETNLSNADTLFQIGKGRFEIGTVTQNDLLDLELSYLNASLALSKAKISLYQARYSLNSFLGLEENIKINCLIPSEIPSFKINTSKALEKAFENNPEILNFEQQLIEADRDIAKAKRNNGISADLDANFGFNKESSDFNEAYKGPYGDDQGLYLSLDLPIIDWGQRKGEIQIARSNKEIAMATVRQGKIDFEQEVMIDVMEFNMMEDHVKIAAKADTIALRGYEVTKQRFLIDKVDVIKLNSARNSLDAAKRNYIQSIQDYWSRYYNIRKTTLYDFENNKTLIEELDDLLQQ